MKTFSLRKIFFTIFLGVFVLGCKKDGEVFQVSIQSAEGPKEGSKTKKNKFTIIWYSYNSCGETDHFSEKENGNSKEIKTYGFRKNDDLCFAMPTQKTGDYYFKTSKAGTYILKFMNSDNTFISDTIVIK